MLDSRGAMREEVDRLGLEYRVHTPERHGLCEKPPAVVMIHGRAGNARAMWTFSKAVKDINAIVVTPQAPMPDPIGGFSWWDIDKAGSSKGTIFHLELILPAVERIEKFAVSIVDLYGIDERKIYVVGFSQGAALAALVSLRNPQMFRGVALLAGFIPSIAFETDARLICPKIFSGEISLPPFFIFHGTQDERVTLEKANAAKIGLERLGVTVNFVSDDVEHKVSSKGLAELKNWLTAINAD